MTDRHGLQGGSVSKEAEPLLRSRSARVVLLVLAAVLTTGFLALGTWQVYRLQWKLALIERVEQRVHAAPVQAPGSDRWPQVTAASDEYRHVTVRGRLDYRASVLTQATTELGAGFWLLTPVRDEDGNNVFVNRGFVTAQTAARLREALADKEAGPVLSEPLAIDGLLRISEPGGGFLRENDPAADRWHSRDIAAIAQARGLTRVAPYFVDAAAATPVPADPLLQDAEPPVGGLTVIAFHNNHLVYALTWYALALMVVAAAAWMLRGRSGKAGRPTPSPR
ncbi:SURF1-like protein [Oxalicibacterium flavum]|uniref:SURF1-like protein n=1 Tax=Oxalicibacterium flavum TaxID=179467 RepID=A0A8J2UKR5_9BURK|nr:SURF1 family protein [Oxalicibacterium flavum]GGB96626.1 SURF1-like protein [Oxalicibacterium flavum]